MSDDVLLEACTKAAASSVPRILRTRRSQQDYIYAAHAFGVLRRWQEENGPEAHRLDWFFRPTTRHSALTELGRLRTASKIVAVALLVATAEPGTTKRTAAGIRAYRLELLRAS